MCSMTYKFEEFDDATAPYDNDAKIPFGKRKGQLVKDLTTGQLHAMLNSKATPLVWLAYDEHVIRTKLGLVREYPNPTET